MKLKGSPRPPMALGIVLGGLVENYMFISTQFYGVSWLARPVVMILLLFTMIGIARPIVAASRRRRGRTRTWKFSLNSVSLVRSCACSNASSVQAECGFALDAWRPNDSSLRPAFLVGA